MVQFSANFELYGNMSRRITELLTTITPRIEVYSVDESFLDLSQLDIQDYTAWGHAVREAILRWTGLPVSIGIAPSKTLAKLASERGKKLSQLGGVLNLVDNPDKGAYLSSVAVQDVWGVGWRLGPKLRAQGIGNALALSQISPRRAQQLMGIRGRQLVAELGGVSCFPLELEHQKPKTILRSRTFGQDTANPHIVEAALASFATTAAFRLRRSHQLTATAGFFLDTNRYKPGFRRWNKEIRYHAPTADTGQIITSVIQLLRETFLTHTMPEIHRAGIWLGDFVPDSQLQTDVFGEVDTARHAQSNARMQALDSINQRFGTQTIRYAAEDITASHWQPRKRLCSPRYTTHIHELPVVRS